MKYFKLLQELGMKLTFVAKEIDMPESTLRHNLTIKEEIDPLVARKLHVFLNRIKNKIEKALL